MRPDERIAELAGPLGEAEQALADLATDSRRRVISYPLVEAVTRNVLCGMSYTAAANAAGINTSTFENWYERRGARGYAEAFDCFEAARALNEKLIANNVLVLALTAAKDSDRLAASKFWLTSRNPRQWDSRTREVLAEQQQRWIDVLFAAFPDAEVQRGIVAALEAAAA